MPQLTTWVDHIYAHQTLALIPEDLCLTYRIGQDRVALVLLYLAHHADAHAEAYPGQLTMALDLGVHRRTVRKALDVLLEAKLIDATGTRGRATIYRLQPHNWGQR